MQTRSNLIRNTVASAALSIAAAAGAQATTFTAFSFATGASTSGAFGGVNGSWGNGDVRLDSVSFNGRTLQQAQLQTVSSASIVVDDGRDAVNGGGNLATGRGINSVADGWTNEGPATVTPTGADLQAALGNFNLGSIVVTRENRGLAVVDVSFAEATHAFFFWERGFNSDLLVEALDADGKVTGSYTILRANYAQSGVTVSTDNGAFILAGQQLGSIGLYTDVAVNRLRLVSIKSDTLDYNGPDYKLLAAIPSAVPEPSGVALALGGLGAVGFAVRRKRG